MYKTGNTRTENGMRGTQGMRETLNSGEYCQTLWGMSSNIPGNFAKHSQAFRGMLLNIPVNVA